MERLKVLSIAVASGKIGYAYFVGWQLADEGIVRKASRRPDLAAKKAEEWIRLFNPDVVVTEKRHRGSRKRGRTWRIVEAFQHVASQHPVLDVAVKREQRHANKYEEAKALAVQFPTVAHRVPKQPKIWQTEPRSTILFEAIALGKVILDGPTPTPANAMG